jgi:hypothetical protein
MKACLNKLFGPQTQKCGKITDGRCGCENWLSLIPTADYLLTLQTPSLSSETHLSLRSGPIVTSPPSEGLQMSETIAKRSVGCTQLNATTFQTDGSTFDILCDKYWGHSDWFYVLYTPDFPTCIKSCVLHNTQNPEKCIGVLWSYGTYGPNGAAGGSECYYFWEMEGPGRSLAGYDAAHLRTDTLIPPTVPTFYDGG